MNKNPNKPLRMVLTLLISACVAGCQESQSPPPPPFDEVAWSVGLDFTHFNGMSGALYFVETVGGGVALLDYDRDGDLDVYLTQGRMLGDDSPESAVFPPPGPLPLGDRLYRNELSVAADGARLLRFTDVTREAGIDAQGYGMGVAVGDYDRDGWPDLYLTQFGGNQLWRNRGDGSFHEATAAAGVDDTRWSTAAAFVDYDRDGWPDLFVCNYVAYTLSNHRACLNTRSGAKDYCGPSSYSPERARLFRNRGDGTFEDATVASGIGAAAGACLGVIDADFNGDGRLDLYVANDGMANYLWLQQDDGRFRDQALVSGSALNSDGMAEASMGVDAADFDNDGDEDLFMTHLNGETNTLYRNNGQGLFQDASNASGLAAPSRGYTGFGTAWLDYDNDGWLDLFVANGEVRHIDALVQAGAPYPLHQTNQLFRNGGDGRFADVSGEAGPAFALSEVSRGAAMGDLDNDGDPDLVVVNNAGPVRLLLNRHNDRPGHHHWLGLRLVDPATGGEVPGARVELRRAGKPVLWRRARVTAGYLGANDPRVLIGLGDDPEVDQVRVHWPDGQVEIWTGLEADRYHLLSRGQGAARREEVVKNRLISVWGM